MTILRDDKTSIFGFDPGTRAAGWAVVSSSPGAKPQAVIYAGRAFQVMAQGVVRPKSTQSLPVRLAELYGQLQDLVVQFQPTAFVIEKAFVQHHPQSALTLGYARGIALAIAGAHNIAVYEYTATTAKKALTGYGHSSKEQMCAMVARLFGVTAASDAADAIALAFCHAGRDMFSMK